MFLLPAARGTLGFRTLAQCDWARFCRSIAHCVCLLRARVTGWIVSMENTRLAVAKLLLETTSLERLRKETRKNRRWVAVYSGFRPDNLSRMQFVRGALPFAHDPGLLRSLCAVFLDSREVEESTDLSKRFAQAGELADLNDDQKALCKLLAEQAVEDLPTETPDTEQPATVAEGVGRPTV
jgi:hypothetical protein